jgi:uncharacterized phage-like protein YoqJ
MTFKFPTAEELRESRERRAAEEAVKQTTVFYTGHRPKDLLGSCYSKDDAYFKSLQYSTLEVTGQAMEEFGILRGLYGAALGFDKIAFFAGVQVRERYPHFKLVLCVPFEEQPLSWVADDIKQAWANGTYKQQYSLRQFLLSFIESYNKAQGEDVWFAKNIREYYEMVDLADEVVYVDSLPGYNLSPEFPVGIYTSKKLTNRNTYMVENAYTGIALFNGKPGGTYNCVNTARKFGRNLYRAHPSRMEWELTYGY